MPGTATGSAQQGPGPTRNVHKTMAPVPPSIRGPAAHNAHTGSTSSGNYPDVTAGIVDIYNHDGTSGNNRVGDSVVPDYPMDSLPRLASTRSLPGQETVHASVNESTSRNSDVARTNTRTSPRASESDQTVVPVTSLSSSTGNLPVHIPASMPVRIPATNPPHIYSVSHSAHNLSPPPVSHSNVSVSVSQAHAQPPPCAGDVRQIRTQDINIGVVSRMEQRPGGSILPDLIAHSQPPPPQALQVSSSQRPQLVDPRLVQGHRYTDPHARHRQHRDRRHTDRPRRHSHRHGQAANEEPCKVSCYKCLAVGMSFRWILVVLSLLGVCCVVAGIVLAALHAAGNSFLFLAIMFIGTYCLCTCVS